MYSRREIIGYFFITVCKAHLDEIANRYGEEKRLGVIVDYSLEELRAFLGNLLLLGEEETGEEFKSRDKKNSPNPGLKLSCYLKELKTRLHPGDYLFLKAILCDDDNERLFLLEQTQMICPENLRIHIIASLLKIGPKEGPGDVLFPIIPILKYSGLKDVRDFSFILDLIQTFSIPEKHIDLIVTCREINHLTTPKFLKPALLYYIMEWADPRVMKKILDEIDAEFFETHWTYLWVQARTRQALGDYDTAMIFYTKLLAPSRYIPDYFSIEIQYNYARCLKKTGCEGKSILVLRELIFSEDEEDFLPYHYCLAIAELAWYYVRTKQKHEAEKVLSKIPYNMVGDMKDIVGADYFVLLGDKSLLEYNRSEALKFYKRAFEINRDSGIKEKIWKIERGN